MKYILSLLIIFSSLNLFAGEMSTIDLIVREAASEDYGYVFYDEWVLSMSGPTTGCLITVEAQASYQLKGQTFPILATYCINRDEKNSYVINPLL